jgi:hypothetical protein
VLEWTRAQVSTLQPDLYGAAVQALIRDLIDTTDGTNLFIDRVWGLSQRYTLGDGEAHEHPLVGCSAPDFELHGGSRLGPKLEGGRQLSAGRTNPTYKSKAVKRTSALFPTKIAMATSVSEQIFPLLYNNK